MMDPDAPSGDAADTTTTPADDAPVIDSDQHDTDWQSVDMGVFQAREAEGWESEDMGSSAFAKGWTSLVEGEDE